MSGQVEFRAFFHLCLIYIRLMPFTTTGAVQTFLQARKISLDFFRTLVLKKRGRPQNGSSTVQKKGAGRPKNDEQYHAFELVVAELTSDISRQWSLVEVQSLWSEKLSELRFSSEPMSTKAIKQMLLERLGGHISIRGAEGKPDILIFTRQQDSIIREFYKQSRETDLEKEKLRILKAAGAVMLDDIMCKENP